VLHVVEGDPQATIIADLTSADHIPSETFDCIILTQTLQLIYDVRAALKTIYRILKPSGVVLATFPGISQTYDNEWGSQWYWNFTSVSARRLFEEAFPVENLKVESFGNVLAAISFLHGLAVDELPREELDYRDPGYDVTIAVRAGKPGKGSDFNRTDRAARAVRQLGSSFNGKALILMYHRVADVRPDPWSLSVSPQHFAQQLEVIRKYAQPIRLRDLVAALEGGGVPSGAVVLTFDDGYADNLLTAKPLLERFDIPATVFVTSGYLQDQREFWWDELDRILLSSITLPEVLRLTIHETGYQWELGEACHSTGDYWQRHRSWKASESSPSARHTLYVDLWRLFQPLADSERRKLLAELLKWARVEPGTRASHRTLSMEEVVTLGRGGLIEIGSHTVTHPLINELSAPLQWKEIRGSKTKLEEILRQPVTSFSYPFGAYAPEIIPIVRQAGFDSACSTIESTVRSDTDPFQLPRVEIKDWDGEELDHRMREWLT
jgi:peptidoglycan/xylan/chitin deacetylase (PgdA/CDA1 family)